MLHIIKVYANLCNMRQIDNMTEAEITTLKDKGMLPKDRRKTEVEAQEKSKEKQLAAVEKFEKKEARHRHHWPVRNAANGAISIGRCECGEPYPED